MIIVTGPYSSKDENLKKLRINTISNACLKLMYAGEISVSPLIFGLALIEKTGQDLPDTYDFWNKFCHEFVNISNKMYVLNMDGWESSNGTKDEIKKAIEIGIPIYLVDQTSLEIIKTIDAEI